jgi:hypothetical protein
MTTENRRGSAGGEPVSISPIHNPWTLAYWALWQRTVIAQQQWLLEWCLGLAAGALNPARSRTMLFLGDSGSRPERRSMSCVGPADLRAGDAIAVRDAVELPPTGSARPARTKSGSGRRPPGQKPER